MTRLPGFPLLWSEHVGAKRWRIGLSSVDVGSPADAVLAGGKFDPLHFDIRLANAAISRLMFNGWGGSSSVLQVYKPKKTIAWLYTCIKSR